MFLLLAVVVWGTVCPSLPQGTGIAPHVPYPELKHTSVIFEDKDINSYETILFDGANETTFVGAGDYLVALDVRLGLKGKVPLKAGDTATCEKDGHPKADCRNFIKVLFGSAKVIGEFKVHACGTNAFNPKCYTMLAKDVFSGKKGAESSGEDRSPKDPHVASPFVYVFENELLFLATAFNGSGNGTAGEIVVVDFGNETTVKRAQSKLDIHPQYVGAFSEDVYVYFASSEPAVESPSKYVSRITRVCADGDVDQKRIVSNLKSTLRCGEYNMVQDTYYIPSEFRMFAIFKMKDSPGQSAVCYYEYSDIDNTFNGTFLCQNGAWEPCDARHDLGNSPVNTCFGPRNALDIDDRVLMNATINPICDRPVFTAFTDFGHITAKRDRFGYRAYLSDTKGRIWNLYIGNCDDQVGLQETWMVVPDEDSSKVINYLDVVYDQVYILTEKRVIRVPLTNIIPTTLSTLRTLATEATSNQSFFPLLPKENAADSRTSHYGPAASTATSSLLLTGKLTVLVTIFRTRR